MVCAPNRTHLPHILQDTDTKRLPGGQTATVAGYAGPGFHHWPSGHTPQDNGRESMDTNPVRCAPHRRPPPVYPPSRRHICVSHLFPRRAGAQRSRERRAPARRAANPIADTHPLNHPPAIKVGASPLPPRNESFVSSMVAALLTAKTVNYRFYGNATVSSPFFTVSIHSEFLVPFLRGPSAHA